jgi:uncharacterized protein
VISLLRHLQPKLHEGIYVFASIPHDSDISSLNPIGTFREAEGLTVIVEESIALRAQLKILFRAAWITLEVHSELAVVGLTAVVSTALAKEGIACNMVAGAFHDHLFVPVEVAGRAVEVLKLLQARFAADGAGALAVEIA